eukprot:SAG31_NODE_3540_length_4144_cov_2.714957_2_plen_105_part_00
MLPEAHAPRTPVRPKVAKAAGVQRPKPRPPRRERFSSAAPSPGFASVALDRVAGVARLGRWSGYLADRPTARRAQASWAAPAAAAAAAVARGALVAAWPSSRAA